MEQQTKQCTKCNEVKLIESFPRSKKIKSGYISRCRDCEQSRQKLWRQKNREHCHSVARKRNKGERYKTNTRNRVARWKSDNREKYLEQKRMQTWRRRARDKGISLEKYLEQKAEREKQSQGITV